MRIRRLVTLALTLTIAVAWTARPARAQKRPVRFDDVMTMKSGGAPMISPDAGQALFTVRQWEPAVKDGKPDPSGRMEARTHVWRVATTGAGAARQITYSDRSETAPAWSPDGRFISFLAARGPESSEEGPRPQVWVMPADGGESWQLTDAKEGVATYVWAPDSARIAFVSRDPLPKEQDDRRRRRDDAEVFEGDFRLSHLWVIDVASRQAQRVTEGGLLTVRGAPSWSPDGTRLAFAAAPTAMVRDERADIYIVSVASRALEKITTNLGADGSPAWSPDGGTIAYVAEPNTNTPKPDGMPYPPVGNSHLMLYDIRAKQAREASSADFDLSPDSPTWAPDSRRLYVTVGRRVYRDVHAYDVAARRYTRLTTNQMMGAVSYSRDGSTAAFGMESSMAPTDVYVSDPSFAAPRRLTTLNPQAADFALGEAEVVTWTSDGLEIEGVLLKPVGYAPGQRYPLLVVVHGGPTGAHVNNFKIGDQVWAGNGWAVLFPNVRGSTNYGEKFMRGNIPDWGGGDYRDIMTGVDALVARGIADPQKLAVMGWSYGGYMTCWIVSQTTRFKAAMMGAGLSNLVSMYGTTDIPDYLGSFFKGYPSGQTLSLFRERSGITGVDKVTTPLLILHGGRDERVPIGQPMEFYRALKDRGKTVELVFYPREGHGLSEYYHQLDRMKRQFEWITKHTLGEGARKPTEP